MKNEKKAREYILKMAKAFGPANLKKYKTWLDSMSSEEFEKWATGFLNDDRANFYIEVENKEPILPELREIAVTLGTPPLEERLMFRHLGGKPRIGATPVPVFPVLVRTHQQLVAYKAKQSTGTRRSRVTGALAHGDKVGRISDADMVAYAAYGADKTLMELLKYKGDSTDAKREYYTQLINNGFVEIDKIPYTPEDSAAYRRVIVSYLGGHMELTTGKENSYVIPSLVKKLTNEKESV